MANRYDPIMCMMVDEQAKAQDANKYVEQAIKWMKEGKGRLEILFGLQQMGLTSGDAVNYYAQAMTETGYKYRPKDAKVKDSNALDKAITTADGMFASTFGEYTKGAKFKKEKFLKELAGISDAEELAKRIQTLDNELKNNLERLDEAYNVASKDYYAARNEIRSIMDAFSREAFSLYKKLDKK